MKISYPEYIFSNHVSQIVDICRKRIEWSGTILHLGDTLVTTSNRKCARMIVIRTESDRYPEVDQKVLDWCSGSGALLGDSLIGWIHECGLRMERLGIYSRWVHHNVH